MIKVGKVWHSAFPDKTGKRAPIMKNSGQVTVASYKSFTGGHAMMYLEYLDEMGFLVTRKVHLVAGLGGSQQAESIGSGSSASGKGINEIEILDEEKGVFHPDGKDAPEEDRADDYYYMIYPMTDAQRASLDAAVRRFITKVANGRYTYRLAGGVIGRLTTAPKVRGINCSDFIIKVLDEAGIAHIKSKMINAPSRIAGH